MKDRKKVLHIITGLEDAGAEGRFTASQHKTLASST